MEIVLRLDVNIYSFLFALVLAFGSRSKSERPFLDYRLFMVMIYFVLFELAADTAMWLLDGASGPSGRVLLMIASVLYYLVHPVAPMLYAMYAVHQVMAESRVLRARLPLFWIPTIASALISLATPFTGWYFYLDSGNAYHHGPLFPLFAAASYVYFIFAFVFVLAFGRRRTIERRTVIGLLLFPLPPVIGGLLQMRYFGLVLIWPAMVVSLLVIYVNIQQRKLSSDYLTGAFSRRRLDEYLEARIREVREGRPSSRGSAGSRRFAGFLADLDDFKSINDRFGHAAGDEALVDAVALIRTSLRVEDFLARYAGDEFVAILPLSNEEELAQIVERVRSRFAEYRPPSLRYRLALSIGAAVFDPAVDANADAYIERLDSLMYREKETKKGRQESASG